MSPASRDRWDRFCHLLLHDHGLGISLDPSRMDLDDRILDVLDAPMGRALKEMEALEGGAVANPDEDRMVGHYWLRDPSRAPREDLRSEIEDTRLRVEAFAARVREGELRAPADRRFTHVLSLGIGGSALGPQLCDRALGIPGEGLEMVFLDNTDPDGWERSLLELGPALRHALVLVISKSGSTPETRNALLEVRRAFEAHGLLFPGQAVAITGQDSALDRTASAEHWLARFPMWDWVGGRTSLWSAVGLLPAALRGVDTEDLLAGAAAMDAWTRVLDWRRNPAAMMAACWHHATGGRGRKDLVVLPYKDRLDLMARYLQQLVMESLGKEKDRSGRVVHQGLTVFGNKGSTDQHAFVQQLRDGVPNFFVSFVRVLADGGVPLEVEPGVQAGDYLDGFLQGTRDALSEASRPSLTLTLDALDARRLGALLALFERCVGLYASLIDVNAYHQPGVEAGKKAAARVLELQRRVLDVLRGAEGPLDPLSVARAAGGADPEATFHVLRHLEVNRTEIRSEGEGPIWQRRWFLHT